jgi:hypothetical protein
MRAFSAPRVLPVNKMTSCSEPHCHMSRADVYRLMRRSARRSINFRHAGIIKHTSDLLKVKIQLRFIFKRNGLVRSSNECHNTNIRSRACLQRNQKHPVGESERGGLSSLMQPSSNTSIRRRREFMTSPYDSRDGQSAVRVIQLHEV